MQRARGEALEGSAIAGADRDVDRRALAQREHDTRRSALDALDRGEREALLGIARDDRMRTRGRRGEAESAVRARVRRLRASPRLVRHPRARDRSPARIDDAALDPAVLRHALEHDVDAGALLSRAHFDRAAERGQVPVLPCREADESCLRSAQAEAAIAVRERVARTLGVHGSPAQRLHLGRRAVDLAPEHERERHGRPFRVDDAPGDVAARIEHDLAEARGFACLDGERELARREPERPRAHAQEAGGTELESDAAARIRARRTPPGAEDLRELAPGDRAAAAVDESRLDRGRIRRGRRVALGGLACGGGRLALHLVRIRRVGRARRDRRERHRNDGRRARAAPRRRNGARERENGGDERDRGSRRTDFHPSGHE